MFHEEGSEQAILISAQILTITYISNFLIHNDNSDKSSVFSLPFSLLLLILMLFYQS